MKRIEAIDLARGYTVLVMPLVHVLLLYGDKAMHQTLPGKLLAFFAEETGAPLFMLLMGMSAALSRKNTLTAYLNRGCQLLLLALLLNLCKFVLPFCAGVLPETILVTLGIEANGNELMQLLLIGDILHLASFSFLVFALLELFGKYRLFVEVGLLLIILLSACLFHPVNLPTGLAGWIFGQLPQTYFPLIPWFFYPLAGRILYWLMDKKWMLWNGIMLAGILFLLLSMLLMGYRPHQGVSLFYKPTTAALLYYTSCSMIWLYCCNHFASSSLAPKLKQLLRFLSRNITVFYMIHWILIFWLMPVTGNQVEGPFRTFLYGSCMTVLTGILTYYYTLLKQRKTHGTDL